MSVTFDTLARLRVSARLRAMDAYAILSSLQNGDVHSFSSTQVDLPPSLADAVRSLQVLIPDDHLTGDGLEMRPHVTVKYGINSDNAAEAKAIVSGTGPITLTLGSTGVFEADDYDVVYVAVDSKDLELLNAALSAGLAVTDTHPTYTPHATVAYVTKGLGKIYGGNPTLTGMTATVDGLRFISKNGMETLIRTAGGPGSGNFGHGGRPGEVGGSTESDAAHQAAHDRGFYHGQTGYGFQKQTAGRKGSTLYKAYRKGYDAGVDASGDLHHTPSSAHDTTEHQQHIARLDALPPAERQKVEEVWDTSRGNAADTVPSSIKGDDRESLIHVMGVRAIASHAEDAGVDPTLVQAFVAEKFGFKSWQALRADADRWANDPQSQRYARFLGGPGSGDFGHGGRPGEVGGSEGGESTGPSQTVYRRTAKTAAEISGKTPDLPVKTIRAYHVTKRENAESILKNGFDLRKVKPRWINDYAVSLSKGKQDSVDYFSRVDPKTNKPIGMDTSKYALLEVTLKGRIGGHDDVKGFSHTAMQYRQDVIDQGYDGQDLGLQIYLHNPQAISQIREIPAPVRGAKKVRGAGGPGSGNFGHGGRPGEVGGSGTGTGGSKTLYDVPPVVGDTQSSSEVVSLKREANVLADELRQMPAGRPTTLRMEKQLAGLIESITRLEGKDSRQLGGPGSGNFGHGGRPGEVGGSGAHTLEIHGTRKAIEALAKGHGLTITKIHEYEPGKFDVSVEGPRDQIALFEMHGLGGPGSGNFGHGGRPGEVGGSSDGEATLGPRPTPIKVTKVKDAIPLILAGKVVELPNVRKVNVLMTRLAKIAKDAKKRGADAPKYDACQIVVPGSNIFCGQHLKTDEYPNGLLRVIMPQFAGAARPGSKADALPKNDKGEVDAGPEFVDYLEKQGIKSKSLEVPSDSLLPSQAQLDGPKIAKRIAKKDYEAGGPIFISRDNYIVDGHHRWAAVVGRDAEDGKLGDSSIRAVKIDAPISEILHIANKWTKSYGLERKAVGRAAGGPGSGNFGHGGRPGSVGGSESSHSTHPLPDRFEDGGAVFELKPDDEGQSATATVTKRKSGGYHGASEQFDFTADTAVAMREKLKKFGARYIGWETKPARFGGGPGSGNFGHEGRPGEIGGSSGQGSASPRGSAKPLKTGKITGSEQLSGTINDVRILTLADETGKSFNAVFKPASGESWTNGEVSAKGYREEFGTLPTSESALENAMNEGHDFNDESPVRETVTNREFSYAEREAAAFDVDEALGLGVVPPTTTRTVDDQWGAVQTFVDTSSGLGYLDDNIDQDSVYGVAVLDIATANTDRHGGNLLVDNDRKLVAIDHGLAFPEAAGDQTEFRPHATTVALIEHQKPMSDAYAARIRQGLEGTDWNSFAAQRWPNMNTSEREGFLERMNTLKDVFDPDVYSDPSSGVRETLYNMSLASSIASHRQAVMHVEYPGNTDKGIQAGHTNV